MLGNAALNKLLQIQCVLQYYSCCDYSPIIAVIGSH